MSLSKALIWSFSRSATAWRKGSAGATICFQATGGSIGRATGLGAATALDSVANMWRQCTFGRKSSQTVILFTIRGLGRTRKWIQRGRQSRPEPAGLSKLAAFDLELSQRTGQRGADQGGLLVVELLRQTRLRALARLLRLGFVDVLCLDRHVGHDGHAVPGDFHEALPHRQDIVLPVLA